MTASRAKHWYGAIGRARHIALTTYRSSGAGVTTPVWFARHGDQLYVFTLVHSGKVKRLRHTARVMLAACTMRGRLNGPTIPGAARFVTDARETRRARNALWRRYHLAMFGVQLLNAIQRWRGKGQAQTLYIAIDSAREAPASEVADEQPAIHSAQTSPVA
jgi:PPOX class probable F420-dependent enzyme